MKFSLKSNTLPACLTLIWSLSSFTPDIMASEFRNVDVRLATVHQARYDLFTEETFTMDVVATVFCSWRNVRTSLKFYAISEGELGHIFDLSVQADYKAVRRSGDLLLRTRKFNFECDEGRGFSPTIRAPEEPGTYYVSACFPTLRDEDGNIYANSGSGNWFSCSEPLTLHVKPRPAPDLITSISRVTPAKQEYQPNEAVSMSVVIRNIGDGRSGGMRTKLFMSGVPNTRQRNSYRSEVAHIQVPELNPGQSFTRQLQIRANEQARSIYYSVCTSGHARGTDSSLPGGYTDAERLTDNNCSRETEIKTTNSSKPSVYVTHLGAQRSAVAPSSAIILNAGMHNDEKAEFKGGYAIYRKKVPALRLANFSSNNTRKLFRLRTKGEVVERNGVLLAPEMTKQQSIRLEAPSDKGSYQYTMCMSHGRDIIGCGNSVKVMVR